jgi:hypothetical protein
VSWKLRGYLIAWMGLRELRVGARKELSTGATPRAMPRNSGRR